MPDGLREKKRYVHIAEASKVSGYTHEYIERLCRLGKIPCRLMGEKKIVELDALLRETGAILLEGEHVGFIEVEDENIYPRVPLASGGEAAVVDDQKFSNDGPRLGSIAVVGETVRSGDAATLNQSALTQGKTSHQGVSLFSDLHDTLRNREKTHIPVQSTLAVPPQEIPTVVSALVRAPVLSTAVETPSVPPPSLTPTPAPIPSPFLPSSPLPPPVAAPNQTLVAYTTKLPAIFHPSTLVGKTLLASLAAILLIAPTSLGMGESLIAGLYSSSKWVDMQTHSLAAAVGLADPIPKGSVGAFPYLKETSVLLSATGASIGSTQQGVVVTEGTGSASGNAALGQAIEKSFSDKVQVVPNADGKSGVIRPVFRQGPGPSYIYVMVPVSN